MIKAIPYGLGLRLKRICTREEDYRKHRDNLKARLVERGYPTSLVEKELKKVDRAKRDNILKGKRNRDEGQREPLSLTYSHCLPNIAAILKNKRHLLCRSEKMANIFSSDSMIAYKRGKNLKDMLVHNKTRRIISNQGGRKKQNCGKECVICRRTYTDGDKVHGPRDGRVTTFDRTIGCRSVNVIYGIWCSACRYVCYVGETGGCLYTRIQNHLSSIRTSSPAVSLPVRHHFLAPGHSIDDVRVVGLERVWSHDVEYRRAREKRWMTLLGTQGVTGGLNKRYG